MKKANDEDRQDHLEEAAFVTDGLHRAAVEPGQKAMITTRGTHGDHAPELGVDTEQRTGNGTQDRVERGEYQTGAMCGGVFSGSAGMKLLNSGRVAAAFGREEHDEGEDDQETHHADDVLTV